MKFKGDSDEEEEEVDVGGSWWVESLFLFERSSGLMIQSKVMNECHKQYHVLYL